MHIEVLLAFATVAWLAILTPGPAVFLALRNGAGRGVRSAIWSSLGNVSGVFLVSAAATLGLGALLASSAMSFAIAKVLGAAYLFYLGLRNLLGRSAASEAIEADQSAAQSRSPWELYREGLLLATTNPKAILFFTALFPQFVDTSEALAHQFLVLTSVFMALSFMTLVAYAALARRARRLLLRLGFFNLIHRVFGAVFVGFGVLLLTLRRPAA